MLQMRDQMLEHEGPPDVEDDFGAERVGLLGLSGVEEAGGGLEGRCRTLESFALALCNKTKKMTLNQAVLSTHGMPKHIHH